MPIKINYTTDLYFNQQIYKKCPRNLKLGIEILKKYGKIVFNRGFSSAGQSACFTRRRSAVRARQSPPKIPFTFVNGIFTFYLLPLRQDNQYNPNRRSSFCQNVSFASFAAVFGYKPLSLYFLAQMLPCARLIIRWLI